MKKVLLTASVLLLASNTSHACAKEKSTRVVRFSSHQEQQQAPVQHPASVAYTNYSGPTLPGSIPPLVSRVDDLELSRRDMGIDDSTTDEDAKLLNQALFHLHSDFDYIKAIGFLRRSLALGNARAGLLLGMMYSKGMGMTVNMPVAIKNLEAAIELGSVEAKIELGRIYVRGWKVAADQEKARALFTEAGEKGKSYLVAMQLMDSNPDMPSIILDLETLADAGDLVALTKLLDIYSDSSFGLEDEAKATELKIRALLHYGIRGTAEDPQSKRRLTKDLIVKANEGDLFAQVWVANAYNSRLSDNLNYAEKHFRYLTLAFNQGYEKFRSQLGNAYQAGFGTPLDILKAKALFLGGAELNDRDCLAHLGFLYESSLGNDIKALEYYERAIELGCPTTPIMVRSLKAKLNSVSSREPSPSSEVTIQQSDTSVELAKEFGKSAAKTGARLAGEKAASSIFSLFF